jgi:hypothetical protein
MDGKKRHHQAMGGGMAMRLSFVGCMAALACYSWGMNLDVKDI